MNWFRRRKLEVLEFRNRGGSIEHFFHFFLAGLLPFAHHLSRTARKDLYFVRSCGPLNKYWLEVCPNDLVIVDKTAIPRLAKEFGSTVLEGFDSPARYDREVFFRSRDFLLDALHVGGGDGNGSGAPADILLINRGAGDPYYNSSISEVRFSGRERRSIPNFEEIVAAVRNLGESVKLIHLEAASLKEHAEHFRNAKVVVMQHGAALADILWMKPETKIVDIRPIPDWINVPKYCGMFDVRLEVVPQASAHAAVDVDAVVDAIRRS